ncbi:D-glycero-D-manno-heptose 1,7-bisphosphate phosphatase [Chitinophaga sp. W3I9]|uniref:D-glycero-alpha-D-manno-heptose-1,7-bisphosphate 7-phosphatase n=1 Tax=Chitinophaga sp. W3I9 TaxID=3373924 RepID=UPI003D22BB2C
MKKAIFIDKDGTLIHDEPYNVNPEKITLEPFAGVSLRRLREAGFALILVSNQAGVAHGYFREIMLVGVFNYINSLLRDEGAWLDGCYYCPHHPEAALKRYRVNCQCRKPNAGMILGAAKDHHIHLPSSWMIGDILNDIEAGNRAGCKTLLLDNGHETEWRMDASRTPLYRADSWPAATDIIIEHSKNPVYGLTY